MQTQSQTPPAPYVVTPSRVAGWAWLHREGTMPAHGERVRGQREAEERARRRNERELKGHQR